MTEKIQSAVLDLLQTCMSLNDPEKFTVWMDYSGHTHGISVRVMTGGFCRDKEYDIYATTYLDFSDAVVIKGINKIKHELVTLKESLK